MQQVRDVMNKDVQVLNQEKNLVDAAKLMRDTDCGSIPVENNDRLVGMITDRDIAIRAVAQGKKPDQELIKNHMSSGIKYCFDTDELEEVGRVMSENHLRRLPVLNSDKRLVGIVSLSDFTESKEGGEELLFNTLSNVCH